MPANRTVYTERLMRTEHLGDGPYLILSLKWTVGRESHCVWWRPNSRGYTVTLDRAGRYTLEEVQKTCDGQEAVAILESEVVGRVWTVLDSSVAKEFLGRTSPPRAS